VKKELALVLELIYLSILFGGWGLVWSFMYLPRGL
jgi:hypothetical protein